MDNVQNRIDALRNRRPRSDLETAFDAIDRAAAAPVAAVQPPPRPPQYGEPQRDAIASVVDQIVRDVTEKIHALHRQLDEMEQQVLQGAAGAKQTLTEQIAVCVRVNDEINHMRDVIGEIAERFRHG